MCRLTNDVDSLASDQKWVKNSKSLPLNKRRHMKKSVRFSLLKNKVQVRHATSEDLKQAWHQREDYKAMESSTRMSVLEAYATLQRTKKEPEGFTARGLEASLNPNFREQRNKWIGTVVGGVLLAQGLQKATGVSNPELLRSMSVKGSEESRVGAILVAALDFQEAAK